MKKTTPLENITKNSLNRKISTNGNLQSLISDDPFFFVSSYNKKTKITKNPDAHQRMIAEAG